MKQRLTEGLGGRAGLRRALLMAAAMAVMTVIVAGIAFARIDYVGGGTWNHGYNDSSVWSYYYHGSRCHTASIKSGNVLVSRSKRPAGYWARASWENTWRVESAYWNNRC